MRRKRLFAGIAGVAAVLIGIGVYVVHDMKAAEGEILAYRSEIFDIRDKAGQSNDPALLRSSVMRLGDIRSDLSYVPSNHRLASWFDDLDRQASEAEDEAVSVTIPLNQRL